jgi:2-polyprenyl-3-methyl-5-hydroxy-6-metoxy-1,4-benzoquinol methylase
MKSSNRYEKFWDRASGSYDKTEKKFDELYKRFIERVSNFLKPEDTVMDFGCGTGLVCNEIAGKVNKVYAIDISLKMIEIAQRKSLERNIQNIDYLKTTIFDNRFDRSSFDVITAFNILHLLENTQVAINRIHDLLKPGGLIISVTPFVGEKPLLKYFLRFGNMLGLIPDIKAFKNQVLVSIFKECKFEIIESGRLVQEIPLYVVVGKKK